jgi:hypothetical protein
MSSSNFSFAQGLQQFLLNVALPGSLVCGVATYAFLLTGGEEEFPPVESVSPPIEHEERVEESSACYKNSEEVLHIALERIEAQLESFEKRLTGIEETKPGWAKELHELAFNICANVNDLKAAQNASNNGAKSESKVKEDDAPKVSTQELLQKLCNAVYAFAHGLDDEVEVEIKDVLAVQAHTQDQNQCIKQQDLTEKSAEKIASDKAIEQIHSAGATMDIDNGTPTAIVAYSSASLSPYEKQQLPGNEEKDPALSKGVLAGCDMLLLFLRNLQQHPDVPRYKRIVLSNASFQSMLQNCAGHGRLLAALGYAKKASYWEHERQQEEVLQRGIKLLGAAKQGSLALLQELKETLQVPSHEDASNSYTGL